MVHKNAKTIVLYSDGNIDFFVIVSSVVHGDALTPYLFILFLNYVFRTRTDLKKENSFTLRLIKISRRRSLAETISVSHYAADLALPGKTFAQAGFRLHSLGQAAEGTDIYVNVKRIEVFFC